MDAQNLFRAALVRPFTAVVLPMFFSLSGFLVAGSLARTKTLVMFMGLRAIRIFPALAVEVVLSALILGPLVTRYGLPDYFSSSLFGRYFYNLVGHVQFVLPGVFLDNPIPNFVNAQLWTVPFELYCYLALGGLAIVGIAKRPLLFLAAVIGIQCVHFYVAHPPIGSMLTGDQRLYLSGTNLVMAFLCGVLAYLFRDRIPWDRRLFVMMLAGSYPLLATPIGDFVAPLPIAYVTVFLGLLNPRKIGLLRGADYSYGLFLYGYAIQQTLAFLGLRDWYTNLPLALLATCLFAALSWHMIEKPALGARAGLRVLERGWLSLKTWIVGGWTNLVPILRTR